MFYERAARLPRCNRVACTRLKRKRKDKEKGEGEEEEQVKDEKGEPSTCFVIRQSLYQPKFKMHLR